MGHNEDVFKSKPDSALPVSKPSPPVQGKPVPEPPRKAVSAPAPPKKPVPSVPEPTYVRITNCSRTPDPSVKVNST